ncbi:melanoma-associated antigen B10-like [Phocoena sinus]|uniref:melanoma-associated antigen B10-like n=1 Tax=Phocoena sinus TaxID=42100 RepID=UPI0013C47FBE|nr:melanoma-associated antigen B10-like [Phocoena sinus]
MIAGSIIDRDPQLLPSEIRHGIGTEVTLPMSCSQPVTEHGRDTKTDRPVLGNRTPLTLDLGSRTPRGNYEKKLVSVRTVWKPEHQGCLRKLASLPLETLRFITGVLSLLSVKGAHLSLENSSIHLLLLREDCTQVSGSSLSNKLKILENIKYASSEKEMDAYYCAIDKLRTLGSEQSRTSTCHILMKIQRILYKYQMKEPVTKADMLRNIIQMYKNHFYKILRKASEHLELVFGLDVKEVDPNRNTYVLVNKLELSYDAKPSDDREVPKTGVLMTVLGVIVRKGNCATEEQVWELLNIMGLYAGRNNFISGEPKKLIAKDLGQERYLEYCQVANGDPPCSEFLWGPRARTETSKMKVLEILAKIHDTVPTAFPPHSEEALRDEGERARARAAARAGIAALASARSRAIASSFSCPE